MKTINAIKRSVEVTPGPKLVCYPTEKCVKLNELKITHQLSKIVLEAVTGGQCCCFLSLTGRFKANQNCS